MKIICPDKITLISADEEDPEYPATNLSNDYPGEPWRATSADAKLTVSVGAQANGMLLAGSNAYTATVTVKDSEGETVQTASYDLGGIETYWELITDTGEIVTALWVDYTYQDLAHTIEIELTAEAGEIVEAGILRAGYAYSLRAPKMGLKSGRVDHSLCRELNDGAMYVKLRAVLKTFRGVFRAEHYWEFFQFFRKIVDKIGPTPVAMQVLDTHGNYWSVFARFSRTPGSAYDTPLHALVDIEIEEVG